MAIEYVDILTREKLGCYCGTHLLVSSFIQLEARDGVKGVDWGFVILPAVIINLLEYIKIWCNIQVTINPLVKSMIQRFLLIYRNKGNLFLKMD